MKLEIAAGKNPQKKGPGWWRHDFRRLPDIDIVGHWRSLGHYRLIEEIYCRHFIEHLPPDEGIEFLEMCHQMLSTGGILTILCPNMKWLCSKYLEGDFADPSEFICWMYGGGDGAEWSFHRSGYDGDLLCRAMRTVGFEIDFVSLGGFLLEVIGVKNGVG